MVSWENQQGIHFFDGKVNLRFRKATERDFIYASNEPKSVLARDLGDCRDNLRNSQSVFLIVVGFKQIKSCRLSDCVPASDIKKVERKEKYDEQTKHIMLY